jgi:hypothetical protein
MPNHIFQSCCLPKKGHEALEKVNEKVGWLLSEWVAETGVPSTSLSSPPAQEEHPPNRIMQRLCLLESIQKDITGLCEEAFKAHQRFYETATALWTELDYARFVFLLMTRVDITSTWKPADTVIRWVLEVLNAPLLRRVVGGGDPFAEMWAAAGTPGQKALAERLFELSCLSSSAPSSSKELIATGFLKQLKEYDGLVDNASFEFKFAAAGLSTTLLAKKTPCSLTPCDASSAKLVLVNACLYFSEVEKMDLRRVAVHPEGAQMVLCSLGLDERSQKARGLKFNPEPSCLCDDVGEKKDFGLGRRVSDPP